MAVYADGPLTNVAMMLVANPSLVDQISEITIMGGAVDVAGNVADNPRRRVEHLDRPGRRRRRARQAARGSRWSPLDATNAVPLTPRCTWRPSKGTSRPRSGETVYKLVRGISGLDQGLSPYLWDQLDAGGARSTRRSRRSRSDGSPSSPQDRPPVAGATVEDEGGTIVRVAIDADRDVFERAFFTSLLGEPFEPVDLSPDISVAFDGDSWSQDVPPSLTAGDYVVGLDNSSTGEAFWVIGWLTRRWHARGPRRVGVDRAASLLGGRRLRRRPTRDDDLRSWHSTKRARTSSSASPQTRRSRHAWPPSTCPPNELSCDERAQDRFHRDACTVGFKSPGDVAEWLRQTACKAVYPGSIPGVASTNLLVTGLNPSPWSRGWSQKIRVSRR